MKKINKNENMTENLLEKKINEILNTKLKGFSVIIILTFITRGLLYLLIAKSPIIKENGGIVGLTNMSLAGLNYIIINALRTRENLTNKEQLFLFGLTFYLIFIFFQTTINTPMTI